MTATTITRGSYEDQKAYQWACAQQGYEGSWEEWLAMPLTERQEYEAGAAGSSEPKQVIA